MIRGIFMTMLILFIKKQVTSYAALKCTAISAYLFIAKHLLMLL